MDASSEANSAADTSTTAHPSTTGDPSTSTGANANEASSSGSADSDTESSTESSSSSDGEESSAVGTSEAESGEASVDGTSSQESETDDDGGLECPAPTIACGPEGDQRCIDPATDHEYCGATESCEADTAGVHCRIDEVCSTGLCLRNDRLFSETHPVAGVSVPADETPSRLVLVDGPENRRVALWSIAGELYAAEQLDDGRLTTPTSYRHQRYLLQPEQALWIDPDGDVGPQPLQIVLLWWAQGLWQSGPGGYGLGWTRFDVDGSQFTNEGRRLASRLPGRSSIHRVQLAPRQSGVDPSEQGYQGSFSACWFVSGSGDEVVTCSSYVEGSSNTEDIMGPVEPLAQQNVGLAAPTFYSRADGLHLAAWPVRDQSTATYTIQSRHRWDSGPWSDVATVRRAPPDHQIDDFESLAIGNDTLLLRWRELPEGSMDANGEVWFAILPAASDAWLPPVRQGPGHVALSSSRATNGANGLASIDCLATGPEQPQGAVEVRVAHAASELPISWSATERTAHHEATRCTIELAAQGDIVVAYETSASKHVQWRPAADDERWGAPLKFDGNGAHFEFTAAGRPSWWQLRAEDGQLELEYVTICPPEAALQDCSAGE